MSKKAMDPNLASILDSIRATVGGEPSPGSEPSTFESDAIDHEALPEAATQPAPRTRPAPSPEPPAKPATARPIPPASHTVEAFLAELIRPQVDAWLAAHLPEIIQKQAADEIARLTGKTQD